MHISEFNLNPKILEDRIRAIFKNEFPYHNKVNIHLENIDIENTMSAPEWDEGTHDVIGYPIKRINLKLICSIEIRTDFEYEKIIEK